MHALRSGARVWHQLRLYYAPIGRGFKSPLVVLCNHSRNRHQNHYSHRKILFPTKDAARQFFGYGSNQHALVHQQGGIKMFDEYYQRHTADTGAEPKPDTAGSTKNPHKRTSSTGIHPADGHWKTTTFLAALRHEGLTAPMVVDGAINGELFLAYVEQILLPTLQKGDIVVMDNLSSHKVAGVEKAIESVEATVLYLPPYSPDFNPIEYVFSKLKTMQRKLKLRTMEELWKKLGQLCDIVAPEECKNYFQNAGDKNKTVQTKCGCDLAD